MIWNFIDSNWDKIVDIATVFSPIVAVIIAAVTCYLSNNDTKKQVKAMKDITLMQLQTTILMIDIEADKAFINKADKEDEVSKLYNKMSDLRSKQTVSEAELKDIGLEIQRLQKSASYQNSIYFKLVNNQFSYMRLLDNIAKSK